MEYNIEELKKKAKVDTLYVISVPQDDDTELVAYLKPITIKTLDLFQSKLSADTAGALDMLFNLLYVDGDAEIKTDVINYQSAINQLQALIQSDEIQFAKSKNGGKYLVKATDEDGNVFKCELRHPTLHELQMQTEAHPLTSFIKMIERIWISGDKEFTTNTSTVFALQQSFAKNIEKREATLKKV